MKTEDYLLLGAIILTVAAVWFLLWAYGTDNQKNNLVLKSRLLKGDKRKK